MFGLCTISGAQPLQRGCVGWVWHTLEVPEGKNETPVVNSVASAGSRPTCPARSPDPEGALANGTESAPRQSQCCREKAPKSSSLQAVAAPEPQQAVRPSAQQQWCKGARVEPQKQSATANETALNVVEDRQPCEWDLRSCMEDSGMCNPGCCLLWVVCCPCVVTCTMVALCKYTAHCRKDNYGAKCCTDQEVHPATSNQDLPK